MKAVKAIVRIAVRSGKDCAVILRELLTRAYPQGPLLPRSLRRLCVVHGAIIGSSNHGNTAFPVLLIDEFVKRIMPGTDW